MEEETRGVKITTKVLALVATLIPYELGFETYETLGFGSKKLLVSLYWLGFALLLREEELK